MAACVAEGALLAGTTVVLAALGVYWIGTARIVCGGSEPLSMLQGMRGAEEAFRAENSTYGGCSATGLQTADGVLADASLYPRPREKLDKQRVPWTAGANTPLGACFIKHLEFRTDGPVRFSFAVAAQKNDEPTYQIIAVGDPDGDGAVETYRTCSRTSEVERWPDP